MRVRAIGSAASASPRKLLIAFGALLIAAAVAVGSGANFNATSTSPGSIISAGTIIVTDSLAGSSILNVTALKPGATTSGAVNITNGGNVPAGLTLGAANLVNVPASPALSNRLTLQVQDLGDPACTVSCPASVTIYSGPLTGMGTLTLGTFQAAATHRYTFAVTFQNGGPDGADNAYGGAATTVDFKWTATQ